MLSNPEWGLNEVGRGLMRAANYMREHGHCKFCSSNNDGNVCLNGALFKTVSFSLHRKCIERLAQVKGIEGGLINKEDGLVEWNNKHETTGEDVISLFEQAAETCRVTT